LLQHLQRIRPEKAPKQIYIISQSKTWPMNAKKKTVRWLHVWERNGITSSTFADDIDGDDDELFLCGKYSKR
jgi:hypothetical protein